MSSCLIGGVTFGDGERPQPAVAAAAEGIGATDAPYSIHNLITISIITYIKEHAIVATCAGSKAAYLLFEFKRMLELLGPSCMVRLLFTPASQTGDITTVYSLVI